MLLNLCFGVSADCGGEHADLLANPAIQGRIFELTVLGPIEDLTVQAAATVGEVEAFAGDGDETAKVFRAHLRNWASSFILRGVARDAVTSEHDIAPWLCKTLGEAEVVADGGGTVIERRMVEVDANATLWTNGRYGLGFPTTCTWASSSQTMRGVGAIQDGPSLCSEDDRRSTSVEIKVNDVLVSSPETCVATLSADVPNGVAALSLQRGTTTGPDKQAFAFYISRCLDVSLPDGEHVTVEALVNPRCKFDQLELRLGQLADGRPPLLKAEAGAWNLEPTSRDRSARHNSTLDLSFSDSAGNSINVTGRIELPQVLR